MLKMLRGPVYGYDSAWRCMLDYLENLAITEKVAINYKKAGELMQDYQRMDKGKNLIQKAIQYAKKANNENLVKELEKDLQVA